MYFAGCLLGAGILLFSRVPYTLSGDIQGTTYHIKLKRPLWILPKQIDTTVAKTLADLDKVASGYRPDSEVSILNHTKPGETVSFSPTMQRLLDMSHVVHKESHGAFDPSAGTLFAIWDFRKPGWEVPQAGTVQTTLRQIRERGGFSWKNASGTLTKTWQQKLVFDAIAQGLSVDMVAEALDRLGIHRYFIEVGGEVRVRGGKPWRIGISYPDKSAEAWSLYGILRLKEGSVATSGTYRRVVVDSKGVTRSHIIDPRTGYPAPHDVVSATVIHPNCGMADALATAVLVLGQKEGLALLDRIPEASGFVIVEAASGYVPYYSAQFPAGDFELK